MTKKALYRSNSDKIIGGVCGGISDYLDMDANVIRLLWVIITLVYGFGLLVYIIAFVIVPEEPNTNQTVNNNNNTEPHDVEIVDE